MRSKIVITSDFEALKEEILGLYGVNSVIFFFAEDFLLENAKEVAAESYIAESEPKLLVLGAKFKAVRVADNQNEMAQWLAANGREIYEADEICLSL